MNGYVRPFRHCSVYELQCEHPCNTLVETSDRKYSTEATCPKCRRTLSAKNWRTEPIVDTQVQQPRAKGAAA